MRMFAPLGEASPLHLLIKHICFMIKESLFPTNDRRQDEAPVRGHAVFLRKLDEAGVLAGMSVR